MRLSSFKVSNYRSIDSAEIELADLTCLVGPNNEGKSNLLRALTLGLTAIVGPERPVRRTGMRYGRTYRDELVRYDPDLDRPVGKDSRALTTITLRFDLTELECLEFQELIGHSLNGDLPAQVQFTLRGEPRIQYKKQRVGALLTDKADLIGNFIRERLSFRYVPPIRTADDAAAVIDSLVRTRLVALQGDPEFEHARTIMEKKAAGALSEVERDLQDVLPRFLPSVRSVHLESESRSPSFGAEVGIRSIHVDDGTSTELVAKGSGVQSLAALALLRHGVQPVDNSQYSILALEEPEAHLHSAALHQLKPLLAEIATEQQLIFATHAGVLVPTTTKATTVIVRNNKATTSKSLADVRTALGVRLSDNLESARLVLVVEGASDATFWKVVWRELGEAVDDMLRSGALAVESTVGAGNVSYQLQTLRRAACDAFVVFDGDESGRAAINKALDDGELLDSDYLLVTVDGRTAAELEDLLSTEWVSEIVSDHFGVSIVLPETDKKWGTRLMSALTRAGKSNTARAVERAKEVVWEAFAESPEGAVSSEGHVFVTLVTEQLLNRLGVH